MSLSGRGWFGIAAAAACALLMGSSVVAAPWLQPGYDAARSGATPDAGPVTDDVALKVRLPGLLSGLGGPVMLDGGVYVATRASPIVEDAVSGVFRLDLATGRLDEVGSVPDVTYGDLASDGRLLFVPVDGGLAALDLTDGSEAWRWEQPSFVPDRGGTACWGVAVEDGTVYASCAEAGNLDEVGQTGYFASTSVVAALDAASGSVRWQWVPDMGASASSATGLPDAEALDQPAYGSGVVSVSVIGSYVLALDVESQAVSQARCVAVCAFARGATQVYTLWALDRSDGTFRWSNSSTRDRNVTVFGPAGEVPTPPGPTASVSGSVTGTSNVIYARFDETVYAVNPARPKEPLWSAKIGRQDVRQSQLYPGFALRDPFLYTASAQTVYGFDAALGTETWRRTIDPALGEIFVFGPLTVAGDTLYVPAAGIGSDGWQGAVHAFDATAGIPRWRQPVGGGLPAIAVRDGVLAAVGFHPQALSDVTILGTTAASPRAVADVGTEYPAPGDAVTVDLSASEPGVLGPVTRFRADWGDGSVTDWQPGPFMTHMYADAGDRAGRFQVGNDANQTASAFVTFHVGGTPPPKLNPIQQAFSPENQNTTWGLVGLVVAGAGALYGFMRLRRSRGRLRRELAALEATYARTHHDPAQCETALAGERARTRALLLDNKLDEAQFALFDKRVDELRTGLRHDTLEHELDFLPARLLRELREALADGRVTAFERRHVLEVLERDQTLTPDYKARVRTLVDAWHAQDATGP